MLIIVMVLGFTIVGVVGVGARNQMLSMHRINTARAFYAAEAGMNMSMRELAIGLDEDGDGTIGGISDDGDDNNNPVIGGGRVFVSVENTGGILSLVSTGSAGASRRRIKVDLTTN
ncbi:MAG: hypothetical protein IIB04_03545 [Acidobacteria bacterium]|nr:hypothetical protein [Acidobacteriota bacterium]